MARSKKRLGLGAILFVLFIAGTGTALAATDHLHNPFEIVPRVLGIESNAGPRGEGGGFEGEMQGEMRGRPTGNFAEGERPEPPAGFERREGGEGGREGGEGGQSVGLGSIQWGQLTNVLSNLWVMGAAAAIVMVVGTPTGRLIKRFRRTKKPATISEPKPVESPSESVVDEVVPTSQDTDSQP